MPDLLRRAAALTLLSALGIALLAPMAARSVASVPADRVEALLPAAPIPVVLTSRGSLSERQAAASLPSLDGEAETLAAAPLPTPNVATMEATIRTVATPRPVPVAGAPVDAPPLDGNVWDLLAKCESGGNWAINTGNGYYGGLQFNYSTWLSNGGGQFAEYAHLATREQQILIAEQLHARRGFQPWPACSRKLGLL
ncbi:MAG: transglycosylase family protein [Candidatus Limnocylindria bacterium]